MGQKSKSTLALMEQAIMILFFAFAAALCVQAFVKAEVLSKDLATRDRAVNVSQTVAETVKAVNGNMERAATLLKGSTGTNRLYVYYDAEWKTVTEAGAVYELCLVREDVSDYLAKGTISICCIKDEKEIFRLPVSWQREVSHE